MLTIFVGVNLLFLISDSLKVITLILNCPIFGEAYTKRNADFFQDLYFDLLQQLEPSLNRQRQYGHRLKRKVYLMDSSIIPLCLSLFDWAQYRTSKGALKLHAVLDYGNGLPSYACLSDGKKADIHVAKSLNFSTGSVVVADRAYVDFEWLFNLRGFSLSRV